MHLTFISTENISSISGGWNGMSYNIYHQLSKYFEVTNIGPINPKINRTEKLLSKILRTIGFKGNFFFFSNSRLTKIAQEIGNNVNTNCDVLFFHGSTPWIKYKTNKPYFAYLDASFYTFLHVYSKPHQFREKDIQRIINSEREFLKNARKIFFSSKWALEESIEKYNLNGANFEVVGLGGNINIPDQICLVPKLELLFISVDFKKKGGFLLIEAFKKLKMKFPDLLLNIIGQQPPQTITKIPGIHYHGYLNKRIPEDLLKLESILKTSFCLVHPTQKDMTPLVIVEAGYYGIPSVAPSRFGIPEMIVNGLSGILIDNIDSKTLAEKISSLLENESILDIRKQTREHFIQNFTWEQVGLKIKKSIEN